MSVGKRIIILTGALALASCTSWNEEAGAFLNEGTFGNSVGKNTALMSGDQRFVVNLNNKFAHDVPTMVNFAFNSATLDAEAQKILSLQANWIRQFPEVRFRVYGHTDLVGTAAYNKALGLRRAQAVVAYLVGSGISRSRLEAVVSYGETQPLIVTQAPEVRNRRTVTEVSGLVTNRQGQLLDGKYAEVIYRDYVKSAREISSKTEAGTISSGTSEQGG